MSADPILQAERLSVRFGGLAAVDDVTFAVPKRGIVALIGPNGAGKTTVFNLVSGFLAPHQGSVRLEGRDITGLAPHIVCRLGLARTFQIVQPFGAQTVRENIGVGAHLHHASRAAALRAAEAVAERVGLAGQLDKLAVSLTIAARKRLELARALATEPKLLLLDEVLAGLNPREIDEVIPVIRGIRDGGVTVLMVEHVMQAVMHLCDEAWVLSNGRVIAHGTPREVTSHAAVIEAYLGHGTAARMKAAYA
jgi:branched-chain amino acid transport system ATP-binding protein